MEKRLVLSLGSLSSASFSLLLAASGCSSDSAEPSTKGYNPIATYPVTVDGGADTAPDASGYPPSSGTPGSGGSDAGNPGSDGTGELPASDAGADSDTGAQGEGGGSQVVDAGSAPVIDKSLCHLQGSEVVVFGDSYIALDPDYIELDTQPFVRNLQDIARAAGALGQTDKYRTYALSGSSMNYQPSIPAQLDQAIKDNPDIKLIVMDGGGNDVLVNNRGCLEYATQADLLKDQNCIDVVDNATAQGQKMFDKALQNGAKAVVYFFYPHLPGTANGGIGAGTYPNTILDYAYPKIRAFCEGQTAAPCYFVDTRPAFDKDGDGLPDQGMINIDGIHPTAASSKILAQTVWDVMQQHCLATE